VALVSAVDVALKQLSLPTSLSRSSKITVAMLKRLMHNTCMNRLANARRSQVIRCLVEGTSVRATVRMTASKENCFAVAVRDWRSLPRGAGRYVSRADLSANSN